MRFREKYVLFFAKIQQTLQSTILLFAYLISVKRLCTESQEVSATKKTATLREGRGFDYGEKSDDYSTTMGLYLGTRAFMMNHAMR